MLSNSAILSFLKGVIWVGLIALFFEACNGGGGEVAVPTYDDLGECTSAMEGSVHLVSDENRQYRCKDGDWEEYTPPVPQKTSLLSGGTMQDPRDGQTYRTVTIGSQTWMAENLNYKTPSSYCYDNIPSNCDKYGRLYTWDVAFIACPSGWHLPSKEEYVTLFETIGGELNKDPKSYHVTESEWTYAEYLYIEDALKSKTGWLSNSGSDRYGFGVLPAGYKSNDEIVGFDFLGYEATFATSSGDGYRGNMVVVELEDEEDVVQLNGDVCSKRDAYSVRCLKDY